MSDMTQNPLTTRLGPMPVYGWAIIIVGGWWGYNYWTSRTTKNVVPTDSQWIPSDTSSVDLSGQTGSATGLIQSPSLPTGGIPAPQTPQAWASIAADWLIGNGAPASVVQTALAKYIGGQGLLAQEKALVDQALTHFGTPPGGPIPVTDSPGAAAKYVIEQHHVGVPTQVSLLVRLWSDPSVTNDQTVQTAVAATINDPQNARYRTYYAQHNGMYPAGIFAFHVVKRSA